MMGRPAKHPQQRYRGITYYCRAGDGYYKAGPDQGGEYLHRAVWQAERGPIPEGFDVHHVNEVKADCVIGNLELITNAEHCSLHAVRRMAARPRIPAVCARCGAGFLACFSGRYCSASCRTMVRMDSGVDDETRACLACAGAFTVNRYSKQAACSLSCAATARWAAYRASHREIAA